MFIQSDGKPIKNIVFEGQEIIGHDIKTNGKIAFKNAIQTSTPFDFTEETRIPYGSKFCSMEEQNLVKNVKFDLSDGQSYLFSRYSAKNQMVSWRSKAGACNTPVVGLTKYNGVPATENNDKYMQFSMSVLGGRVTYCQNGVDNISLSDLLGKDTLDSSIEHTFTIQLYNDIVSYYVDSQLWMQARVPAQGFYRVCATAQLSSTFINNYEGSDKLYNFGHLIYSPFPLTVGGIFGRYIANENNEQEYLMLPNDGTYSVGATENNIYPMGSTKEMDVYNRESVCSSISPQETFMHYGVYSFTVDKITGTNKDGCGEFVIETVNTYESFDNVYVRAASTNSSRYFYLSFRRTRNGSTRSISRRFTWSNSWTTISMEEIFGDKLADGDEFRVVMGSKSSSGSTTVYVYGGSTTYSSAVFTYSHSTGNLSSGDILVERKIGVWREPQRYGTISQRYSRLDGGKELRLYLSNEPIAFFDAPKIARYAFKTYTYNIAHIRNGFTETTPYYATRLERVDYIDARMCVFNRKMGIQESIPDISTTIDICDGYVDDFDDLASAIDTVIGQYNYYWLQVEQLSKTVSDTEAAVNKAFNTLDNLDNEIISAGNDWVTEANRVVNRLNDTQQLFNNAWSEFGRFYKKHADKCTQSFSMRTTTRSVSYATSISPYGRTTSTATMNSYPSVSHGTSELGWDGAFANLLDRFTGSSSRFDVVGELGFEYAEEFNNVRSAIDDWVDSFANIDGGSYDNEEQNAYEIYADFASKYISTLAEYNSAVAEFNSAKEELAEAVKYVTSDQDYEESYYGTIINTFSQYESAYNDYMNSHPGVSSDISTVNSHYNNVQQIYSNSVSCTSATLHDKDVINIMVLPNTTTNQKLINYGGDGDYKVIIDINGENIQQSTYETNNPIIVDWKVWDGMQFVDMSFQPLFDSANDSKVIHQADMYSNLSVGASSPYLQLPYTNYNQGFGSLTREANNTSDNLLEKVVNRKHYKNCIVSFFVTELSSTDSMNTISCCPSYFTEDSPTADEFLCSTSALKSVSVSWALKKNANNEMYLEQHRWSGSSEITTTIASGLKKGDRVDILLLRGIGTSVSNRTRFTYYVYVNGTLRGTQQISSATPYNNSMLFGVNIKCLGDSFDGLRIKELTLSNTDTLWDTRPLTPMSTINSAITYSQYFSGQPLYDGCYKNNSSSSGSATNGWNPGYMLGNTSAQILKVFCKNRTGSSADIALTKVMNFNVSSSMFNRANDYGISDDTNTIVVNEKDVRKNAWNGASTISNTLNEPIQLYKPIGHRPIEYNAKGYCYRSEFQEDMDVATATTDSSTPNCRFEPVVKNYYAGQDTGRVEFGLPSVVNKNGIGTTQRVSSLFYANGIATIDCGSYTKFKKVVNSESWTAFGVLDCCAIDMTTKERIISPKRTDVKEMEISCDYINQATARCLIGLIDSDNLSSSSINSVYDFIFGLYCPYSDTDYYWENRDQSDQRSIDSSKSRAKGDTFGLLITYNNENSSTVRYFVDRDGVRTYYTPNRNNGTLTTDYISVAVAIYSAGCACINPRIRIVYNNDIEVDLTEATPEWIISGVYNPNQYSPSSIDGVTETVSGSYNSSSSSFEQISGDASSYKGNSYSGGSISGSF